MSWYDGVEEQFQETRLSNKELEELIPIWEKSVYFLFKDDNHAFVSERTFWIKVFMLCEKYILYINLNYKFDDEIWFKGQVDVTYKPNTLFQY